MNCKDCYWCTVLPNTIMQCNHDFVEVEGSEANFCTNRKPRNMSKELFCGECDKLLYEDVCGYGNCKVNGDKCYCGDLCHLNHGKP